MSLLIKSFGILLIFAGILLFIKPDLLFGWIENNLDSKGLYFAAILGRFGMGTILILGAKSSKYPRVFQFLGFLGILAAIIFIIIGHGRFTDLLSMFIPDLLPYAPVSGLIGLALGGFLIHAVSGKKNIV